MSIIDRITYYREQGFSMQDSKKIVAKEDLRLQIHNANSVNQLKEVLINVLKLI